MNQYELASNFRLFEKQFAEKLEAQKQHIAWLQANNERREAELKKKEEEFNKTYNYVPQSEPEIKPVMELTGNEFMEQYRKHGESFINHTIKKLESSPEFQEIRSHSTPQQQPQKREPKNLSPEQILKQMKDGDLNELLSDLGA